MALTLSATTNDKQNVLLTLNLSNYGVAVRVAALQTSYICTLTAINPQGSVTWGLFLNPSWLSLEPSNTTLNSVQVKFTSPSADSRMFLCYVKADDGVTQTEFPLAIEVLEPLSLAVSGRTNNYMAYDSTATPVIIQALGLNATPINTGDVQFVTPIGFPSGISLLTASGNSATLKVAQPSINSVSGGMAPSAPTTYNLLAY